ncbi:uncharacterized protein ACN2A1_011690 isoform 2-T2 [Glossina fuscipes fuscipes]
MCDRGKCQFKSLKQLLNISCLPRIILENVKNTASDIHPLGKVLTMIGTETDDEDANDDSDESDSHEDEDDDTIDRAIPGIVERSALGSYSPGDEINLNDDLSAAVVGS